MKPLGAKLASLIGQEKIISASYVKRNDNIAISYPHLPLSSAFYRSANRQAQNGLGINTDKAIYHFALVVVC